jgi:hypothetical protein
MKEFVAALGQMFCISWTNEFLEVISACLQSRNSLNKRPRNGLLSLSQQSIQQPYSISGPRATSGSRDVADWPDNGPYS